MSDEIQTLRAKLEKLQDVLRETRRRLGIAQAAKQRAITHMKVALAARKSDVSRLKAQEEIIRLMRREMAREKPQRQEEEHGQQAVSE